MRSRGLVIASWAADLMTTHGNIRQRSRQNVASWLTTLLVIATAFAGLPNQAIGSSFAEDTVGAESVQLVLQEPADDDQEQERQDKKPSSEVLTYFLSDSIPELRLIIEPAQVQALRDSPREYARVSLWENGVQFSDLVEIKLKGAAGSYQEFDDRPGFTVKVDRVDKSQRFHGMQKFHLNNSVQDETFLSEWIGSKVYRAAGYPAPLVHHVRLWVNDRDMGLYVLREGFDRPFMERSFGEFDGWLFDGGFLQDIDSPLEVDLGGERQAARQLEQLVDACREVEFAKRLQRVAERVDRKQLVTFMALERMLGHWDGYTLNQNNYRLYVPKEGKAIFLPHGMDQLLQDPWAGLYDFSPSMLAKVVLESDEWRNDYRNELLRLSPLFQNDGYWDRELDRMTRRLAVVLKDHNPEMVAEHWQRVQELKERLRQRGAVLADMISSSYPITSRFDEQGIKELPDWYPEWDSERFQGDREETDEQSLLWIESEGSDDQEARWRTDCRLTRGRYRLEAQIQTIEIVPSRPPDVRGAGLRWLDMPASPGMVGSNGWSLVGQEFEVVEDLRVVELAIEFGGRQGRVEIDLNSIRLIKLD